MALEEVSAAATAGASLPLDVLPAQQLPGWHSVDRRLGARLASRVLPRSRRRGAAGGRAGGDERATAQPRDPASAPRRKPVPQPRRARAALRKDEGILEAAPHLDSPLLDRTGPALPGLDALEQVPRPPLEPRREVRARRPAPHAARLEASRRGNVGGGEAVAANLKEVAAARVDGRRQAAGLEGEEGAARVRIEELDRAQ